jgi:glutaconate CoA-transferase subunit B
LLRGRVLDELHETYPDFAAQMRREISAGATPPDDWNAYDA